MPGAKRPTAIAREKAVQLKTDRAVSMRREHFEPGQAIFREGDHGDWLSNAVTPLPARKET